MENLFEWICIHASEAYLVIVFLILLSGLCLPISEELMLLIAGAIASNCLKGSLIPFFIAIYLACCLSAWEAYWLGRLFGPRILEISFFKRMVSPKRLQRLSYFYEKYGILTFLVGRFCPGGVRNALFISSGLTKMPFLLFALRDAVACLSPCALFLYLGFHFGKRFDQILFYFKKYEEGLLILTVIVFFGLALYLFRNCYKDRGKL